MARPASATAARPRWRAGLGRTVVALGAVSFCTDIASEMIVPVRILFLVLLLGTPLPLAGLIEGLAESAASLLKIAGGRLADRVARRAPFLYLGYGLSALAKPLLATVPAWPPALGWIVADRLGKGVRGSPRDALIADATPPGYRGKAFGFHRAMDTAGAAIGPLLTVAILARSPEAVRQTPEALRRVFAFTAIPGALSLVVLLLFLRERPRVPPPAPAAAHMGAATPAIPLGRRFWIFTAIALVFALGNTSDAFIFLRTAGLEYAFDPLEAVPLLYCAYNVAYALLATPLGALSDRWGRLPVLIGGYAAFGLVYTGWAIANHGWQAWVLFLVYGGYAAATDGVARAFVADCVPQARRGTALGWFGGLTGLLALPANVVAGWLWSGWGPVPTFACGAALGLLAAALLLLARPLLSPADAVTPAPAAP